MKLRRVLTEIVKDDIKKCPAPTQDVALNTANRDRAIEADFFRYDPLNVEGRGATQSIEATKLSYSGVKRSTITAFNSGNLVSSSY